MFVVNVFFAAGVEGSRQFRGDGYLIFTPDPKPIVLPWTVNFVFRTRQSDAFLIRVEMGPANFASVEVHSYKRTAEFNQTIPT